MSTAYRVVAHVAPELLSELLALATRVSVVPLEVTAVELPGAQEPAPKKTREVRSPERCRALVVRSQTALLALRALAQSEGPTSEADMREVMENSEFSPASASPSISLLVAAGYATFDRQTRTAAITDAGRAVRVSEGSAR